MTPTARCLKELRDQGYDAEVVERRLPRCFVTKDLFGFADIIYIVPPFVGPWKGNIVLVQVTSGPHHAARKAKILAEPRAIRWIKAGGLIELWSYSKKGAKGKRKLWECRKEQIVETDFTPETSGKRP